MKAANDLERNRTVLLGVRTWTIVAWPNWLRDLNTVREAVAVTTRVVPRSVGMVSDTDDDLRLLRAGQTGDREALAALFTRHETALFRVCRGILNNAADAEDAVQETLLRALRALAKPDGFRGQSSVKTWLYRIAVNVCLEWKRQRRPSVPLEEVWLDHAAQPGPEAMTLERMRVAEALGRMMPRQRALILLREQEEWSAPEIAEMLGWNVKKVEYELFKIRKVLAAWRAEEGKGE